MLQLRRTMLLKPRISHIARAASSTAIQPVAAAMQKAFVCCKPEDDNITVTLTLAGRQRNLNRPKDEALEKPLARIKASVLPNDKKQKRKKGQQGDVSQAQQELQQQLDALTVALYEDEAGTRQIDSSTSNVDAWPSARLLRVGQDLFEILVNPPIVESISLPGFPMVGYPVLPVYSLAFADEDACAWRWLRRRSSGDAGASSGAGATAAEWEDTGCREVCYTPTPTDEGCSLRVECIPARGGPAAASGEPLSADAGPVRPGPELPAARSRHLAPPAPVAAPGFRVMSYNILADQYAGTAYAQKVLFNYCPSKLLDNNYRRQLVLEEVLAYQPDVLCLQEVDDKVFSDYLEPHLKRNGFEGRYTNKQGRVREGAAMFWRASRFRLAGSRDLSMRDVFRRPLSPPHHQFDEMLEGSPHLAEALQKVTTIAQISLLLPVEGPPPHCDQQQQQPQECAAVAQCPPLVVVNTHLFFHPFAPHIRSMHTAAMLEEAAAAIQEWTSTGSLQAELAARPPPTPLFVGDLNSDLNSGIPGVVELLRSGRLAADHWDWKDGSAFRWGKEEGDYAADQQEQEQQQQGAKGGPSSPLPLRDGHDFDPPAASPTAPLESPSSEAHGVDLVSPFMLSSADDLATPYTNYTSGYKALLDYVWHDPQVLAVSRQLPCPPEQLLGGFVPSPRFPSDHLAVAYDLVPVKAAEVAASKAATAAAAAASQAAVLPALPTAVEAAADALRRGKAVLLPSDTLYGVAADASSAAGVAALMAAKRRLAGRPVAIAVADVSDAGRYCQTEGLPEGLLQALLPGPVTLLLPAAPGAPLAPQLLGGGGGGGAEGSGDWDAARPAAAAGGGAVVGLRVPQCEFLRAVARRLGGALALSSANVSGGRGPLELSECSELLAYCAAAIDGGRLPLDDRRGSTVVDLTGLVVAAAAAAARKAEAAGSGSGGGGGDGAQGGHGGREYAILREGVAADGVRAVLEQCFGLRQRA